MHFEQLPNEILLYVFEFFGCFNLIRSFADLNIRFHTLLYHQYARHCVNTYWWSKREFDMMCQQQLPRLRAQIVTLDLGEDNRNPGAVNLFFSYAPSLAEFTRLRSLTLSDLNCYPLKKLLIEQLPSLRNLRHLRLRFCISSTQDDAADHMLINHVWSLPKLADCTMYDSSIVTKESLHPPSIVSSSLQCVSLTGRHIELSALDQLLQQTPNLRTLRAYVSFDTDHYTLSSSFPKLSKLHILTFKPSSATSLLRFLQSVPNLRHLDASLSTFINGHQWQQLIGAHLPDLRTLHFSMKGGFDGEDHLNTLMDTFRTSFWIDERRWYVRCILEERALRVQTSSRSDYCTDVDFPRLFKSTNPNEDVEKLFKQLSSIYSSKFFDHPFPAKIQFTRLDSLSLKFPIAEQVWRALPQFAQLKYLRIHSYASQFASQLQTILDRATRLNSLSLDQAACEPMDMSWFEHATASIRHLTLHGRPLNEAECRTLSRSPLARRCETLNLCVDNRENILALVRDLPTLRALHFLYKSIDEELVQWLREHLPASCYASSSSAYLTASVRIWLS